MANTRTAATSGIGEIWAVDSTGNIDFGGNPNLTTTIAIVSAGTATVNISVNIQGTWFLYNNGGLGGTTSLNALSFTAGQTLIISSIGPFDGIRVNFSALGSTATVAFEQS